ncbi:FAD-binding protein [Yoonia sp. 208BN28-4]|uniref:FAD-binding protein n=1 Tax=Yoonia sp. 208BN28-4 TaxID=3126505 RepID=UPI0030B1E5DD
MHTTEDDIAQAIAAASGPLQIIGGGTRPVGQPAVGEALPLAGLSGVTLYEPGALTLVAKAGTPVSEIEKILAAENQRLAFEPMDFRTLMGTDGTPTIGAVVAGNVSGPRRIAVGACRDFLLGVRFVDGSGQVVKNGGRVMKNVTGYDLVKLMCGAYGTLGALTEVSLKVMPMDETSTTLRYAGQDVAQSVALMSAALGTPFEVTGAARKNGDTLLRLEGFAGSVAYRVAELQKRLASFGTAEEITDAKAQNDLWTAQRDVTRFADRAVVWRVSLRPSHAAGFVEGIDGIDVDLDWGGGLLWIAAQDGADHEAIHHSLQDAAAKTGGHATLIKGPDALRAAVPTFQPQEPNLAAITKGLRAKFDPRGILNTGVMI